MSDSYLAFSHGQAGMYRCLSLMFSCVTPTLHTKFHLKKQNGERRDYLNFRNKSVFDNPETREEFWESEVGKKSDFPTFRLSGIGGPVHCSLIFKLRIGICAAVGAQKVSL